MKRPFILLIALALAACSGANNNNPAGQSSPQNPIEWDRKPGSIIFRADVEGGQDDFTRRNEIPDCTLYGDNTVVWRNDVNSAETQALFDKITDDAVRNFITFLTINQEFYKYEGKADLQLPSAVTPAVETLTLTVNNSTRKTDSYSGWDQDYYDRILRQCKALGTRPVLFDPAAAWISAKEVPYNTTVPSILWDGDAAGLKLADLAASGQRKWVTDKNVKILWNVVRNAPLNTQFSEGDKQYEVAVEVPNINRDVPPAPGG
jgi:hypothetical protein